MKHIHFPLILLTIMLACNLFTACNDDEGGGIPVIHHIRLTDPEKADSTFTDVNPGTMIVAIGENLNGVKKVFINQQEVSFNSNYSTSTNLILTIPADLPLVGANPDLKDELRIETTHGTAIYSMHVLSPAPYITRIATTFPVEVGTPLRVIGGNFYEIQRIYFTTAEGDITDAPVSTEITEFTVNKDFSEISFNRYLRVGIGIFPINPHIQIGCIDIPFDSQCRVTVCRPDNMDNVCSSCGDRSDCQ